MKSGLICFTFLASMFIHQAYAQTGQNQTSSTNGTNVQNATTTSNETVSQNDTTTTNEAVSQNATATSNETVSQNATTTSNGTASQNVTQQADQKVDQKTKKQSNETSSTNATAQNQTSEQPKKVCPLWKCDSDMPKDWCYKFNASDQTIHAANITKNESSCYILNYFETGEQSLKKDKQGYPLNAKNYFQSLSDTLCKNRNWQNQARCKDFCTPRLYEANVTDESGKVVLKNLTDFKCTYDQYLNNHSHSPVGLREWEECEYDNQCSSKHCECVPNSQNIKGRCTTSVYDDEYRYFWKHICEDKDADQNWERNTCEDFLQILYAHVTQALDDDDNLPCLQTFSDYDSLIKIHDDLESLNQVSIIGWVIAVVVVCLIICVVCGASQKEKIKEQYEKFRKNKSKKKPLLQQTEPVQA